MVAPTLTFVDKNDESLLLYGYGASVAIAQAETR
jgi:hypothetical protein